jgi:pimeloyl-ACP methyl ester carboxylesterase
VTILAESAPNARLEVLTGADHPVHVQRADAVNALVRDFLLDVDRAAVTS